MTDKRIEAAVLKAIASDDCEGTECLPCDPVDPRDCRCSRLTQLAITAYEKELEAEGMVVVPQMPTQEMMFAGGDADRATEIEKPPAFRARIIYRAMLAALNERKG